MKGKIMIVVAVAVLVGLPAISFAATYGYVNKAGNYATVEAVNATAALRTPDIDAHSGVILVSAAPLAPLASPIVVAPRVSVSTGTTTATSTMSTATSTSMMVGTSTSMMSATSSMMMSSSTTMTASTTATSTVQ